MSYIAAQHAKIAAHRASAVPTGIGNEVAGDIDDKSVMDAADGRKAIWTSPAIIASSARHRVGNMQHVNPGRVVQTHRTQSLAASLPIGRALIASRLIVG